MVTARILRDDRGRVKGFTARGHAGFDIEGRDIVCSAFSVLIQSTLLGLTEYLEVEPELELEAGSVSCLLPEIADRGLELQVEALLETMVIGLKKIEKRYACYIQIEEREVDCR